MFIEENKCLKKKLVDTEINLEKTYKNKYENEIKEIKENYCNLFKQFWVKNNITTQNLQKEKYELVEFFEKYYVEKNFVDKKFNAFIMFITRSTNKK